MKFAFRNNRRLCVGLVLPYLKPRGTEKQALAIARGLVERGTTVVLFVVQGWGDSAVYNAFRDAGARVVNVGAPIGVGGKQVSRRRVLPLAVAARRHRCSVLFSRASRANRVCALAGRISFIPTLASISRRIQPVTKAESAESRMSQLIRSLRFWRGNGFPSRFVTVSQEGAANAARRYPLIAGRVRGIRNGVDADAVRSMGFMEPDMPVPADTFLIGFSGSVEMHRKGLDILLSAMHRICAKEGDTDIHLVVVGSGEDEDIAKQRVVDLQLEKSVSFVGETGNPHAYISRCDLFVLPSRMEGLPNVLLEAMANGVCSIAADCDTGPREIITDGVNGRLFPVGDSRALADLIVELRNNDEARAKLAAEGEHTARTRFSQGRMVEEYASLLHELSG
ncbi:MAG: glycosyltransferase [Spirochaetales bacterium]